MSSLAFLSCLVLSCLLSVLSVSLSLSLSLSLSPPRVGVVVVLLCCVVWLCVLRHAEKSGKNGEWIQKRLRTHGDVLNPHTGGRRSSPVLLSKICPHTVYHVPQRSTKETLGSFQFSS